MEEGFQTQGFIQIIRTQSKEAKGFLKISPRNQIQ